MKGVVNGVGAVVAVAHDDGVLGVHPRQCHVEERKVKVKVCAIEYAIGASIQPTNQPSGKASFNEVVYGWKRREACERGRIWFETGPTQSRRSGLPERTFHLPAAILPP